MNIALFTSDFYPSKGGVQEVARQLAHEQQRRGDRPLIITNRWPKTLPQDEDYEGIPVRRYVFRVREPNFRQMGGALLYGPWTLHQICADLKKHKADVINIQCVSSNAHYAVKAARRLRLPLVASLHGELSMDSSGLFEWSHYARNMMHYLLDHADAITVCSQQALKEAETYRGKPLGDRARVIYSGVRLDDFKNVVPYEYPRPYILAIGRHASQKGFDVLLRAFAAVKDQGDQTHDLILAGDGEERAMLERLAAELNIADRVKFIGWTDRPTTLRLFTGCSFFVLPSRREAMGIVNLEAMASGKAIVATRVGGVGELVQDNVNGLFITPNDPSEMARAIARMIQDVDLRNRLGEAGKSMVKRFDWGVSTEQFSQVYQAAADRYNGAIPQPGGVAWA
jgi:glycosyltransferase involved in cell wall biosynthesis